MATDSPLNISPWAWFILKGVLSPCKVEVASAFLILLLFNSDFHKSTGNDESPS